MTTYGVTDEGFATKPLDIIKAEIEQALKDLISPALDVSADGPLGQFIGVIAEAISEGWEVAEAVYRAFDPDNAGGDGLQNIAALTGAIRLSATASTVTVCCTGTAATVLTVGRVLETGNGDRLASTEEATLAAADVWAVLTAYVLDDIASNDSNTYVCVQAGTSAAAGGPTGTGDGIVDGTCKWNFCGDGTSYALVPFEAEETGPVSADAGAIDTEDGVGSIETPVAGWDDARNLEDAEQGRDEETDAAFRLRREQLLRMTGAAALDAIRADILDVEDVTACRVFENTTDVTDGDGLPPHSFEALVLGGTDQDIADQIWESKAAGIASYGSESASAEDSQGDSHTMYFSRPTEKDIYVIVDLTKDDDYPSDGDAQVKAALAAHGDDLGIGSDVVHSALYAPVFGVSGVVDVTGIKIDFSAPPAGTSNLVIGNRELSMWDTADIVVNAT